MLAPMTALSVMCGGGRLKRAGLRARRPFVPLFFASGDVAQFDWSYGNVSFNVAYQMFNQLGGLVLPKAFLLRVAITGVAKLGTVKGKVDVFGKSPDRVEGLRKRCSPFEDQRRCRAFRQGEYAPQGPADPEVFFDDRVGNTPTGTGFPKECGTLGGRKAGDLIQYSRPARDRRSTATWRASRRAPGPRFWPAFSRRCP